MGKCLRIVNFEHISHLVLVFLLLTLNMQLPTRTVSLDAGVPIVKLERIFTHLENSRAKC